MRTFRFFTIALISTLALTQCIDETYFGESKKADITKFTIDGELSNKIEPLVDWKDIGTVTITVHESADLSDLKVTTATCSPLAHFKSDPLKLTDFTDVVTIYVEAETKGVVKQWNIIVTKEVTVEDEQLAYSSMMQWSETNRQGISVTLKDGTKSLYPGDGTSATPWNSTIESNAYGGGYFEQFTNVPYNCSDGTKASRIRTIKSPMSVVANMGMALATGNIFTGNFIFNPVYMLGSKKEPRKLVDYGVPFYSKPTAVKFKMRYAPGPVFMNGKTEVITLANANGGPTADGCDVHFILMDKKSQPGTLVRVGGAFFRTERGATLGDINDDVNGFVEMELPFIYGQPTAEQIAEKPYCAIRPELTFYSFTSNGNGTYTVSADPIPEVYSANPTGANVDTIIAQFSSSISGDVFLAAPGSTLDVKDIEFVYE